MKKLSVGNYGESDAKSLDQSWCRALAVCVVAIFLTLMFYCQAMHHCPIISVHATELDVTVGGDNQAAVAPHADVGSTRGVARLGVKKLAARRHAPVG
jgi:hypothetical protein